MPPKSPVTQPVTVAVSPTLIARFGAQNPPYILLNQSTSATVWISNNPGMAVGQGQPLFPGTSLTWNTPGNIYLIADAVTTVIVSQDITDWQPDPVALGVAIATALIDTGIILTDDPVELFADSLAANDNSGLFDISRFQCLYVSIHPTDTITYPSCPNYSLRFEFGGVSILTRTLEFSDEFALTGGWHGVVPCIGTGFRVISNGTNSTADVRILGSNRPYKLMQEPQFFGDNGNPIFTAVDVLAAGAQTTHNLPCYVGEVEILCTVSGGNHATSFMDVQSPIGNTNRTFYRAGFGNPVGTLWQTTMAVNKPIRLALTGAAHRLLIDNGDAAQRTFITWVNPIFGSKGEI